MNKTKIVCSIGPASSSVETLEKMIDAGMNVARFNMSHGTHESHKLLIDAVKQARQNKNKPIAIMIDTKGPEIRVKQFENGKIMLKEEDKFTLTTKDVTGTNEHVSITYKNLPKILKKDTKILLNDGNIELRVQKITTTDIVCEVVHGGELSNNKSINIPGVKTEMPYLSEQDKSDLLFAKEMDADYIAISFVNSADDVLQVKEYLKSINFKDVKIISKIESDEGVKNYDKILKVSDGIMVARGDLGVEIDFVKIPILQKEFIGKCNYYGKIVITATQMLESMINNARPTRAEISDVANAVEDGSSAVMLSGESSAGKYPVLCVETMAKIVVEREKAMEYGKTTDFTKAGTIEESIGHVACSLARSLDAKAIIVATNTGLTAKNTSRFRPACPIIACTPSQRAFHQMSIYWGVYPMLDKECKNSKDLLEETRQTALSSKLVKKGDLVVQTTSIETPKPSDMVTVSRI